MCDQESMIIINISDEESDGVLYEESISWNKWYDKNTDDYNVINMI